MLSPFDGDMEESFRLFVERHKNQKEEVIQLLAEFCRVTKDTARRWVHGGNMPIGEPQLRLKVFLTIVGIRVTEFATMPKKIRELAELIALGVLDADEVSQMFRYAKVQELFRVLRGEMKVLPTDKARALDTLLRENASQYKSKRAGWMAIIEQKLGVDLTSGQPASATQRPSETKKVYVGVVNEPLVVDCLVEALSQLLETDDRSRKKPPRPLNDERRLAIFDQVDEERIRRLIAQLEMLM